MPIGNCSLCGIYSDLTFEHIPPRSASNKSTRYTEVPYLEFLKDNSKKPFKGKVQQGGTGFYSLCNKCNTFLGTKYVASYTKLSTSLIDLITREESNFKLVVHDFQPAKVLKQIAAMFISVNQSRFVDQHEDLKNYVRDPNSKVLPEHFRFFIYLNAEGHFRHLPIQIKGGANKQNILASEITFPPLGQVMTVGFKDDLPPLQEITYFKNFEIDQYASLELNLEKLPTYIPLLLDYRDAT